MTGDEQLAKIAAWLEDVSHGRIHLSERRFASDLVQKAAGRVKTKYREYSSEPSPTERMTLEAGKGPGAVRAARLPHSPINIFQLLSKNVIGMMEKPGLYRVKIRDGAVHPDPSGPRPGGRNYPGGVPLGLMAYWIENPKPYTIQMTLRQLGYLHAVREGRGGFLHGRQARKHLPDQTVRYVIVFDPPERPVWKAVAQELIALADLHYKNPFFKVLRQFGTKYGMK